MSDDYTYLPPGGDMEYAYDAPPVELVRPSELSALRAALAAATQRAETAERDLSDECGHKDVVYAALKAVKARNVELEAKLAAVPDYVHYCQDASESSGFYDSLDEWFDRNAKGGEDA